MKINEFLNGRIGVRIHGEMEHRAFRKILKAFKAEYIAPLNKGYSYLKEMLEKYNSRYPQTFLEPLCYTYQPWKGICIEWEHEVEKQVEDDWYDEIVDFGVIKQECKEIIEGLK